MIKITLTAGRGAGKSFVATVLAKHLTELGYEVSMGNVNPTVLPKKYKGIGRIEFQERVPF